MRTLGKVATAAALWEGFWYFHRKAERIRAFKMAREVATAIGKPLLVIGVPEGEYPCGDVTLDLRDTGECKNFVQGSVESIPFPDKHFGAAFCSHVLEHVCDPHTALKELYRVADKVFIVYPQWWTFCAWTLPGHTWLVTEKTGPDKEPRYSFTRIRASNCNKATRFGRLLSGELR